MSITLPPLPYALTPSSRIFRGARWLPITDTTRPHMWPKRVRLFSAPATKQASQGQRQFN